MIMVSETPLMKEWHQGKNTLSPQKIATGSHVSVWWLGECGHEWEARVYNRPRTGCPYCANRSVLKGFNDLETLYPSIAIEFNTIKNEGLKLSEIISTSNKKVWWKCGKNHEWEAPVSKRTKYNYSCPYCSNQKILSGFNDLTTLHPRIAAQWHPTKNGLATPHTISAGANKKVWWKCDKNHEWEASVYNRTRKNHSCPYCSNQKKQAGFNDLKTLNPELATQWHPTKNRKINIETIASGSDKKVWWLGECGHEWESLVYSRKNSSKGCPVCNNLKIVPGINDLATTHPEIAKHWHPTKNLSFTTEEVSSGSEKRAWWTCDKGHEWESRIAHRQTSGCPHCSSRVSKAERYIADFLKAKDIEIRTSVRDIINGMELDIYIPGNKIAIEYNGLYWHTEESGKDRNYHYNKWLACKNKGIQLIQIWEDDWNTKPSLILNSLLNKLNKGETDTVYARKTIALSINSAQSRSFLELNHIQGFSPLCQYFGLYNQSNNTLHAVMAVKITEGNQLNIIRYATNRNVPGGFSKLLKYIVNELNPQRIITFSDHTVSNGGLYANNGFIADKELPPDYMYVVNRERKHKFGYRLKRFRNDPELQYVEGYTESQLAKLNNLPRIWDAGKTRWVKEIK